MINEQDLNNLNELDLECSDLDTLDINEGFGNLKVEKTGIMVDLSDDDDVTPVRNFPKDIQKQNSLNNQPTNMDNTSGENVDNYIDMECSYGEDDDADFARKKPVMPEETGLVLEKTTKKNYIDQGTVEKDFWDKLQKKHLKSAKKHTFTPPHTHFSGNPKAEMDMFNADMHTGSIPTTPGAMIGADVGAGESSGAGDAGGSCAESLNKKINEGLSDVFDIIGFKIIDSGDKLKAVDAYDKNNCYEGKDMSEILFQLKPYVDDYFICPLEVRSKQKFDNYTDWINWYDTNCDKEDLSNCADDITYIKIVAKYI